MLIPVLPDQPDRALPQLGRVPCCLAHDSSLSKGGVSTLPGAVQVLPLLGQGEEGRVRPVQCILVCDFVLDLQRIDVAKDGGRMLSILPAQPKADFNTPVLHGPPQVLTGLVCAPIVK